MQLKNLKVVNQHSLNLLAFAKIIIIIIIIIIFFFEYNVINFHTCFQFDKSFVQSTLEIQQSNFISIY